MPTLPPSASATSRQFYGIAQELAALCPATLGREIALTGSASHGWSDQYSDIELNLWADAMPDNETLTAWLKQIGATDIYPHFDAGADASSMSIFTYQGIIIEAGWQTLAHQQEVLETLLSGKGSEWLIHNAEIVTSAVPLRTEGELAHWREMVADYPDTVLADVVAITTLGWQFSHWLAVRWSLVSRHESLALSRYLAADISNVLRIVWAANRRWGPHLKWVRHSLPDIPHQPANLVERMEAIVAQQTATSVADTMHLMLEALALLPPNIAVSKVVKAIQASLNQHYH